MIRMKLNIGIYHLRGLISLRIKVFMRELGKMAKDMVVVNKFGPMAHFMKVIGRKM